MAEFDLEKLTESCARILGVQIHTWAAILLRPTAAFRDLSVEIDRSPQPLFRSIGFGFVTIAILFCIGKIAPSRGTPSHDVFEMLVAIIFLLVFLGLIVHITIVFLGGRASPLGTIALSIYAICSLLLIGIPIAAFTWTAMFKTKVTLTYSYEIGRNPAWINTVKESFYKEDDPQRDVTILPRLSPNEFGDRGVVLPENRPRLPLQQSGLPAPQRNEKLIPTSFAIGFLAVYLATTLVYLTLALGIHFRIPAKSVASLVPAGICLAEVFWLIYSITQLPAGQPSLMSYYPIVAILCLLTAIGLTWQLKHDRFFPTKNWRGLLLWSGCSCGIASIIALVVVNNSHILANIQGLFSGSLPINVFFGIIFQSGMALMLFPLIAPLLIVIQAVWMRFGWKAAFSTRLGWIGFACACASIIDFEAISKSNVREWLKALLYGPMSWVAAFWLVAAAMLFPLVMTFLVLLKAIWMRFGERADFFRNSVWGSYVGSVLPIVCLGGMGAILGSLLLGGSLAIGSILGIWLLPGFRPDAAPEKTPESPATHNP